MNKINRAAIASLAVLLSQHAFAAGDPAAGNPVFDQQCSNCHTTVAVKNRLGPSLDGVVGRRAGGVPGCRRSTPPPARCAGNLSDRRRS
jgi:cytochrome c